VPIVRRRTPGSRPRQRLLSGGLGTPACARQRERRSCPRIVLPGHARFVLRVRTGVVGLGRSSMAPLEQTRGRPCSRSR
jgi:hypothetical protein